MRANNGLWKMIMVLFFVMIAGTLLVSRAPADSTDRYYGTSLSISAAEYQPGQALQLTVRWRASYASGQPEQDSGLAIHFSGMKAVEILDDNGSSGSSIWSTPKYRMNYEDSFSGSCNVSIPDKYLEPGTLVISASINQTTGTSTVVIPDHVPVRERRQSRHERDSKAIGKILSGSGAGKDEDNTVREV